MRAQREQFVCVGRGKKTVPEQSGRQLRRRALERPLVCGRGERREAAKFEAAIWAVAAAVQRRAAARMTLWDGSGRAGGCSSRAAACSSAKRHVAARRMYGMGEAVRAVAAAMRRRAAVCRMGWDGSCQVGGCSGNAARRSALQRDGRYGVGAAVRGVAAATQRAAARLMVWGGSGRVGNLQQPCSGPQWCA